LFTNAGLGVGKALAIDDSRLYWVSVNASTGSGSVQSVLKDGGALENIASNQPSPLDIAVDGTNVYWSANQTAPPTPTTSQCLAMYASDDGGTPTCATSGAFASMRMTVISSHVVVLSQGTNVNPNIGFSTIGGPYQNVEAEGPALAIAATPTVIFLGDRGHVDPLNWPGLTFGGAACLSSCGANTSVDMTTDVTGQTLLWVTQDDGVYSLALPPVGGVGTQLAQLPETPVRMARDLSYVYATTTNSVFAVPIAPLDAGLPTLKLAGGEVKPFGIAVDATYVYWTCANGTIRAANVPPPPP
jgi:hypothetical protein